MLQTYSCQKITELNVEAVILHDCPYTTKIHDEKQKGLMFYVGLSLFIELGTSTCDLSRFFYI